MTWKIREGWEHRAFIGVGPFSDEHFKEEVARVAAEFGWTPDEVVARTAVYEQTAEKPGKES